MKKAINREGKKIHYVHGLKSDSYFCPYCFEKVYLRTNCFAHQPKKDRTPQERICPEYKAANGYSKVESDSDRAYISNGGVPIYLSNQNENYEIRAVFPKLTEDSENILKSNNAKIIINKDSKVPQKYVEVYSIENLNNYRIKTLQNWIKVEIDCDLERTPEEVRRKWLWGIRGIDIDKDVFHSHKNGGYRVARGGNLVLDKEYLILSNHKIESKAFIEAVELGKMELEIAPKRRSNKKEINIYSIKLIKESDECKEFCESRGCKFSRSSPEVLPLWPPGLIEGTSYITDKEQTYFSIKTEYVEGESVGCHSKDNSIHSDLSNIVRFDIDGEFIGIKRLIKDDEIVHDSVEIKFNPIKRKNLVVKPALLQKVEIYSNEENLEKFNLWFDLKENEFLIDSNPKLQIKLLIYKGARIIEGSNLESGSTFHYDPYKHTVLLDYLVYGKDIIEKKENAIVFEQDKLEVDWNQITKKIIYTKGHERFIDNDILEFINLVKKRSDNRLLYRELLNYRKKGKMPVYAIELIKQILKRG